MSDNEKYFQACVTGYTRAAEQARLEGRNAFEAGVLPDEAEAVCHYKTPASAYLRRAWMAGYTGLAQGACANNVQGSGDDRATRGG